jgi:hypothetical protein
MGSLCGKKQQTTSNLIETEKEVSIPTYKSDADKYYDGQENKYNYFKKINFADFLYSLVHFSNENATIEENYEKANVDFSMDDTFFTELFSTDIFQSFLENKILKHKSVYQEAGNNENVTSIFKEAFLSVNNALGLKLSQDAKAKGDESADKNTIVKKGDVLPIGLLYCVGANYIKIRALFNIFSQDGIIKSSDKFSEFLLSLFIIASYGMASARNKLSKYGEIGEIEKEKLKELLDTSELKDCQNMVDVTNDLIFGTDRETGLNYADFKNLFNEPDKDKSLAYLLSASGARYMLKKNNV